MQANLIEKSKATPMRSHYEYRELSTAELLMVGGGDADGNYGGTDGGYPSDHWTNFFDLWGEFYGGPSVDPQIFDPRAESLLTSVQAITAGPQSSSALTGHFGNITTGVVGPIDSDGPTSDGVELANPGLGNPAGDPGPNFADDDADRNGKG